MNRRHRDGRRRFPPLSIRRGQAPLVLAVLMLWTRPGFSQTLMNLADDPAYLADEVKAAFLYHFGTYVEWPADEADFITIAVLEADALSNLLQQYLVDRTIGDRPVRTRVITNISELTDEQILFIGSSANSRLDELLMALNGRPILVVTDAPEGLMDGAVINFVEVGDRVQFEISLASAREAGLTLSSRLLTAALYVEPVD